MSSAKDYEKITFTQKVPNGNLQSDRWGSLAEMYRDLKPAVTYQTFYARVRKGMDPMTAANQPRDSRGRKGRITFS